MPTKDSNLKANAQNLSNALSTCATGWWSGRDLRRQCGTKKENAVLILFVGNCCFWCTHFFLEYLIHNDAGICGRGWHFYLPVCSSPDSYDISWVETGCAKDSSLEQISSTCWEAQLVLWAVSILMYRWGDKLHWDTCSTNLDCCCKAHWQYQDIHFLLWWLRSLPSVFSFVWGLLLSEIVVLVIWIIVVLQNKLVQTILSLMLLKAAAWSFAHGIYTWPDGSLKRSWLSYLLISCMNFWAWEVQLRYRQLIPSRDTAFFVILYRLIIQ